MGYEMPPRPTFLERALQGLAFWVGHRRSIFDDYPIPEAALVTEAANLIQANLESGSVLRPEVRYTNITTIDGEILTDRCRADLVILNEAASSPYDGNVAADVQFVMEVKRASAATAAINRDLQRLYQFKRNVPEDGPRAFLIVVGEMQLPERFVEDSTGTSKLHRHDIPNCEQGCFHVRRTVKAAASFKKKTSANYVSLLEVFSRPPAKLPII